MVFSSVLKTLQTNYGSAICFFSESQSCTRFKCLHCWAVGAGSIFDGRSEGGGDKEPRRLRPQGPGGFRSARTTSEIQRRFKFSAASSVHIALDARIFLQVLSRPARAANELSLSLRLAACARRNSLQQHFPAKSVAQKTLTKNPKP